METLLPEGCGNAPRVGIVADLVSAWVQNDDAALAAALDATATWTVAGDKRDARAGVVSVLGTSGGEAPAERLDFADIITHGRLASCTGTLTLADGRVVEFSHHVRFKSAGKTAPVVAVRTFLCIDGQGLNG